MYCIFERYVRTLTYYILAYVYRRVVARVAETQFEPWAVRH